MGTSRIVLVTGANRGIGREIARKLAAGGHVVIATARKQADAEELADSLSGQVHAYKLDVRNDDQIWHLTKKLRTEFGRIDVLINNAGVMSQRSAIDARIEDYTTTFDTNLFGPIRVSQACLPLLKAGHMPGIVNISSGMGELASLRDGGYAPYRLSKAALNAHTIMWAKELEQFEIRVNAMCPGWVQTDMGGSEAPRKVSEGADTAVWLATELDLPTGKFFRDRKVIPW